MKYAIVAIEKPVGHIAQMQGAWPAFQSRASGFGAIDGKEKRLAENCWLLYLENDTGLLANIVALAQEYDIGHRVLYFQDAPTELFI